jgi:hypothetical protein
MVMSKVTWNISGRIRFEPTLPDGRTAFGTNMSLEGVRVLVEAKEFEVDLN